MATVINYYIHLVGGEMDKNLSKNYQQNQQFGDQGTGKLSSDDFMKEWKRLMKEYEQELNYKGFKKVGGRFIDLSQPDFS